jgi:hypothetical protein
MAIVYAADLYHDGGYVKKRGDSFTKADADKYFDGVDPKQLLEDGVICMDSSLPENVDDHRSPSLNELEAQMARENAEDKPASKSADKG